MGLDMYLEVRKYVSQYDYKDGERFSTPEFSALQDASGIADLCKFSDFGGMTVSYPVGYWRKANAIHGWFVRECGGGVDECQDIYVPREKLVELRDLCKSAVSQPAMAGDILPPTGGFFFGSYEIDEWYMHDMKKTIEMLDHVLSAVPEDSWVWSFNYRASW
jgi:hypothetical protein